HDHKAAYELRHHAGAWKGQRAERQIAASSQYGERCRDGGSTGNVVNPQGHGAAFLPLPESGAVLASGVSRRDGTDNKEPTPPPFRLTAPPLRRVWRRRPRRRGTPPGPDSPRPGRRSP